MPPGLLEEEESEKEEEEEAAHEEGTTHSFTWSKTGHGISHQFALLCLGHLTHHPHRQLPLALPLRRSARVRCAAAQ